MGILVMTYHNSRHFLPNRSAGSSRLRQLREHQEGEWSVASEQTDLRV